MNNSAKVRKNCWFRLITIIVITTILCHDIAWAGAVRQSKLSPESVFTLRGVDRLRMEALDAFLRNPKTGYHVFRYRKLPRVPKGLDEIFKVTGRATIKGNIARITVKIDGKPVVLCFSRGPSVNGRAYWFESDSVSRIADKTIQESHGGDAIKHIEQRAVESVNSYGVKGEEISNAGFAGDLGGKYKIALLEGVIATRITMPAFLKAPGSSDLTPDGGGRWPWMQKFYDRIGRDWIGQALSPALTESGMFSAGGSLLLSWLLGLQFAFAPPVIGIIIGFQLLWHILHGKGAFSNDKLIISGLILAMLSITAVFNPTGSLFAILLFLDFVLPHILRNALTGYAFFIMSLVLACAHPPQGRRVISDPEAVDNEIEQFLSLVSPKDHTWLRTSIENSFKDERTTSLRKLALKAIRDYIYRTNLPGGGDIPRSGEYHRGLISYALMVIFHPEFEGIVCKNRCDAGSIWSWSIAVVENLIRFNMEFNNENISWMLKMLDSEIQDDIAKEFLGPGINTLIIVSHEEDGFDPVEDKNIAVAHGTKAEGIHIFKGSKDDKQNVNIKESIRRLLKERPGPLSLWYDGHGLPTVLGLRRGDGISPHELAEYLFDRVSNGKSLRDVIIFIDACYSYDFADFFYNYLFRLLDETNRQRMADGKPPMPYEMPLLFSVVYERGLGIKDLIKSALKQLPSPIPVTVGRLLDMSHTPRIFELQDSIVFIPVEPSKYRKVSESTRKGKAGPLILWKHQHLNPKVPVIIGPLSGSRSKESFDAQTKDITEEIGLPRMRIVREGIGNPGWYSPDGSYKRDEKGELVTADRFRDLIARAFGNVIHRNTGNVLKGGHTYSELDGYDCWVVDIGPKEADAYFGSTRKRVYISRQILEMVSKEKDAVRIAEYIIEHEFLESLRDTAGMDLYPHNDVVQVLSGYYGSEFYSNLMKKIQNYKEKKIRKRLSLGIPFLASVSLALALIVPKMHLYPKGYSYLQVILWRNILSIVILTLSFVLPRYIITAWRQLKEKGEEVTLKGILRVVMANIRKEIERDWRLFTYVGIMLRGFAAICTFAALVYTSAFNVSLFMASTIVVVLLIDTFVNLARRFSFMDSLLNRVTGYRPERPKFHQFAFALLAGIGVYIALGGLSIDLTIGSVGLIILLLQSVLWSSSIIYQNNFNKELLKKGQTFDPISIVNYSLIIGTVCFIIYGIFASMISPLFMGTAAHGLFSNLSLDSILTPITHYLDLGLTSITMLVYYIFAHTAPKYTKPASFFIMMSAYPLFVALFSWMFYGAGIYSYQIIGALIVVASISLFNYWSKGRDEKIDGLGTSEAIPYKIASPPSAPRDNELPEQGDTPAGRCVTGDTILPLLVTRYSLLDCVPTKIVDVKPGDYVLSLNEETQKIEPHRINALLDMGIKPAYRLTTASGRSIKTTANHPYLTRDGWIKVSGLKTGDEIGVPGLRSFVKDEDSEINCQKQTSNNKEDSIIHKDLPLTYDYPDKNNQCQYSGENVKSQKVHDYFESILDSLTAILRNNTVIAMPIENVSQGIFPAASGTNTPITNEANINFAPSRKKSDTTSNLSLDNIQHNATIQRVFVKDNICIEAKSRDVLWDRIVSIEYIGYEHVYDIEVEGTHNFIGNGIFAHNTYVNKGEGNVSCGTICESGHEGSYMALDSQLARQFEKLRRLLRKVYPDSIGARNDELTEEEADRALVKYARSFGIAVTYEQLKEFRRQIKEVDSVLEEISIFFSIPETGTELFWVGEDYAGGHFNRAGTRMHISLPIILERGIAAGISIARHELAHIQDNGHQNDKGIRIVKRIAKEEKKTAEKIPVDTVERLTVILGCPTQLAFRICRMILPYLSNKEKLVWNLVDITDLINQKGRRIIRHAYATEDRDFISIAGLNQAVIRFFYINNQLLIQEISPRNRGNIPHEGQDRLISFADSVAKYIMKIVNPSGFSNKDLDGTVPEERWLYGKDRIVRPLYSDEIYVILSRINQRLIRMGFSPKEGIGGRDLMYDLGAMGSEMGTPFRIGIEQRVKEHNDLFKALGLDEDEFLVFLARDGLSAFEFLNYLDRFYDVTPRSGLVYQPGLPYFLRHSNYVPDENLSHVMRVTGRIYHEVKRELGIPEQTIPDGGADETVFNESLYREFSRRFKERLISAIESDEIVGKEAEFIYLQLKRIGALRHKKIRIVDLNATGRTIYYVKSVLEYFAEKEGIGFDSVDGFVGYGRGEGVGLPKVRHRIPDTRVRFRDVTWPFAMHSRNYDTGMVTFRAIHSRYFVLLHAYHSLLLFNEAVNLFRQTKGMSLGMGQRSFTYQPKGKRKRYTRHKTILDLTKEEFLRSYYRKGYFRPGFFGKRIDDIYRRLDEWFGKGNWQVCHFISGKFVSTDKALELYEDAYVKYFRSHPGQLEWLVNTARDVYDNSLTNIKSGTDYSIQETKDHHFHDIAIRRAVKRLGKEFKGKRYIQIRGHLSAGYHLNPGIVPFHRPGLILRPELAGWWRPGSIEAFYQSNKVIILSLPEIKAVPVDLDESLEDLPAARGVEVDPDRRVETSV